MAGLVFSSLSFANVICSSQADNRVVAVRIPNARNEMPTASMGSTRADFCRWLPIVRVSKGGTPPMIQCHFRYGPDGGTNFILRSSNSITDLQTASLQDHGPNNPGKLITFQCE